MDVKCKEHSSVLTVVGSAVLFCLLDAALVRLTQNRVSYIIKKILGYTPIVSMDSSTDVRVTKMNGRANSNNGDEKRLDANEQRWWKIRNIILSWIHSLVSGPLALLSIYLHPAMLDDVIGTCSSLASGLVSFSLGYFVHDSVHMLRHKLSVETVELLLHHLIIFLTYGTALVQQSYVAYAVVSLLMELNSIFLHARQLANIHAVPKSSDRYRLLSRLNIGSFVVFRVLTTGWMSRWMAWHWGLLPLAIALLGAAGLVVISVMNCVLLLRLVRADLVCLRPKVSS